MQSMVSRWDSSDEGNYKPSAFLINLSTSMKFVESDTVLWPTFHSILLEPPVGLLLARSNFHVGGIVQAFLPLRVSRSRLKYRLFPVSRQTEEVVELVFALECKNRFLHPPNHHGRKPQGSWVKGRPAGADRSLRHCSIRQRSDQSLLIFCDRSYRIC